MRSGHARRIDVTEPKQVGQMITQSSSMAGELGEDRDSGLGVVVVTHAHARCAIACVKSFQASIAFDRTVVVVNQPASISPDEMTALHTCARVIVNDTLCGYGENANKGVAALPDDVDIVIVSNDDVIFGSDTPRHLARLLRQRSNVAVSGPAILGPSGSPEASSFAFPSVWTEVGQEVILPAALSRALRSRYARPAVSPSEVVDSILGAVLAIRRSAFNDVGGFDSGFFLYSEETDLCRRLRSRGWLTVSLGAVSVIHLGGASTGSRYAGLVGSSRGRYIRRHWPWRQRLALMALRVFVSIWNNGYVTVRIALRPSSRQEKLHLLRAHRVGRAKLRSGPSRGDEVP